MGWWMGKDVNGQRGFNTGVLVSVTPFMQAEYTNPYGAVITPYPAHVPSCAHALANPNANASRVKTSVHTNQHKHI